MKFYLTILFEDPIPKSCLTLNSPRGVYYHLTDIGFSHDIAANAEGWCELSSVGESYFDEEYNDTICSCFYIEVIE